MIDSVVGHGYLGVQPHLQRTARHVGGVDDRWEFVLAGPPAFSRLLTPSRGFPRLLTPSRDTSAVLLRICSFSSIASISLADTAPEWSASNALKTAHSFWRT